MNDQDRDNRIENLEWLVGGLTVSLINIMNTILQDKELSGNIREKLIHDLTVLQVSYFQPWNAITKPDEPIPISADGTRVAYHKIPFPKTTKEAHNDEKLVH